MTDSKSVVAQATRGSNPRLSAIISKGQPLAANPFFVAIPLLGSIFVGQNRSQLDLSLLKAYLSACMACMACMEVRDQLRSIKLSRSSVA